MVSKKVLLQKIPETLKGKTYKHSKALLSGMGFNKSGAFLTHYMPAMRELKASGIIEYGTTPTGYPRYIRLPEETGNAPNELQEAKEQSTEKLIESGLALIAKAMHIQNEEEVHKLNGRIQELEAELSHLKNTTTSEKSYIQKIFSLSTKS